MIENNNDLPKGKGIHKLHIDRKINRRFFKWIIIAAIVIGIIYLGFFANFANPINRIFMYIPKDMPVVKNVISQKVHGTVMNESDEQQDQLEKEKKSLSDLADRLQDMEDKLDKKEEELNDKEAELEKRETDLNTQQTKVTAQVDNIKKLSGVYNKMDPKAAANSLTKLNDNNLAAQILKNMSTEQAGAILSNMEASQAAAITKALAPQ